MAIENKTHDKKLNGDFDSYSVGQPSLVDTYAVACVGNEIMRKKYIYEIGVKYPFELLIDVIVSMDDNSLLCVYDNNDGRAWGSDGVNVSVPWVVVAAIKKLAIKEFQKELRERDYDEYGRYYDRHYIAVE